MNRALRLALAAVACAVLAPLASATVVVHHTSDYTTATTLQKAVADAYTFNDTAGGGRGCNPTTLVQDANTAAVTLFYGGTYVLLIGTTSGGSVDQNFTLTGSVSGTLFKMNWTRTNTAVAPVNPNSAATGVNPKLLTWTTQDGAPAKQLDAIMFTAIANETTTITCNNNANVLSSSFVPYQGQGQPYEIISYLDSGLIGGGFTNCPATGGNNQCDGSILNATENTPGTPTVTTLPSAGPIGGCLSLTWTAGTGATGYSVFGSTTSHSVTSPMNNSGYAYRGHTSTTSFTDCGLNYTTTYHYRIVGTTPEGAPSGDASNITASGPAVNVTATRVNNTVLNVSWTNVRNANMTGFSVFQKTASDCGVVVPMNSSFCTYVTHTNVAATNYTLVSGLTPSTTYCFRVVTTNATTFGEGDISPIESTDCASTSDVPLAPTLYITVAGDCGQTARLNWTTYQPGPTAYTVYRNSSYGYNRSWPLPPYQNFSLKMFNDSPPQAPTSFTYTVTMTNANGTSSPSNTVNLTLSHVHTVGTCGLQYGGSGSLSTFAANAGISTDSANILLGIVWVIAGAAIGFLLGGTGGGAALGASAGILSATALGELPLWSIMLAAAVMLAGFFMATGRSGRRRRSR